MASVLDSARNGLFSFALVCISRALVWRDGLLGRIDWSLKTRPGVVAERFGISSGRNVLDAVLIRPKADAKAALLICHGIGEVVEQWLPVQQLLAEGGVASLVFDYSGYGRSSGQIDAAQCDRDAVAAFRSLQARVGMTDAAVLGYSMGSGVATAIAAEVGAKSLILCASFSSLRAGACSLGFPKWLAFLVPPVWRSEEVLKNTSLPVLILHGERDELFPVEMARGLHACCGERAELVVVPGLSHNEPFYRPDIAYWGYVIDRVLPR